LATVPGTSFERVAEVYDETRGGQRRGDSFADDLAPWIVGPRVVELGIGTGVIAHGLRRHGIDVVGVDLSPAMLMRALDRVGPRVAVADVDVLPLADSCVDSALLVWVLQLVDDPVVTLAEAARVVRPGGRIIALPSSSEFDAGDEMAPIIERLAPLKAHRMAAADAAGAGLAELELIERATTGWDEFEQAPAQEADTIEQRQYSSLFDVDDATWREVVVPVIDDLRALPDPSRPRRRRNRHPILVWTVRP
jgi:ubiquinone/menaquinone biosynthesis C-methylase UbiE